VVERTTICPPSARLGPVSADERKAIIGKSPLKGKYDTPINAESAYEILAKRVASQSAPGGQPGQADDAGGGGWVGQIGGVLGGIFGTNRPRGQRMSTGQLVTREITRTVVSRTAGSIAADLGKSVGGSVGGSIGRAIIRGALGGILRR
jgi:hypothetical protein